MPFNADKMANLILKECESIEERCEGYNDKLAKAIVGILSSEKQHSVKGIPIQKEVNSICKEAGDFLAKNRNRDGEN